MSIDSRIVEEFSARAPFAFDKAGCLVIARVGSHSHGTYVAPDNPDAIDDVDYMGIVVPPPSFTLGVKQWEGMNFVRDELDVVFYSFSKFVRLLLKANPNVLGLLWMREEDFAHKTAEWDFIRANRMHFAALNAYGAFAGYASGQLYKMTAFDAAITDEWDKAVALVTAAGWKVDDITDKSVSLPMPTSGNPDELNEARITIQRIHARHFQGYMGEKRKRLVKRHGYDTKNASHLIRLLRMAVEFLETGHMNVFRNDAAELIAIKQGAWTLDEVKAHAENLFARAKEARATSPLLENPAVEAIDQLAIEIHCRVYALESAA